MNAVRGIGVLFFLCVFLMIALLVAILVCVLIHYAALSRKDKETKAMLRYLMDKPMVAPVVTVTAPVRTKGPVQSYAAVPAAPAASAAPAAPVPLRKIPAPYTAGEVKLYTVPDKIAAMLMAITADELKIPVNELKFLSIREIPQQNQA
jgi:hypothetical protein